MQDGKRKIVRRGWGDRNGPGGDDFIIFIVLARVSLLHTCPIVNLPLLDCMTKYDKLNVL